MKTSTLGLLAGLLLGIAASASHEAHRLDGQIVTFVLRSAKQFLVPPARSGSGVE